jgi:type IV pilus assembly protein PilE
MGIRESQKGIVNMNRTMRGFTLIEAMVVVAILGIIVAFGYPSYRDQVMKSRRSEGMSALLELADRLERYYSDKGTYVGATPANIFRSTTEKGNYQLTIDSQDAIAFAVSAAPLGGQTEDRCGKFTLTSQGAKTVSGPLSSDDCWK